MKINIQTIPHSTQRYPTAGDWWLDPDQTWQIRVSDIGDWRMQFLTALHEMCEMALCHATGISAESVDAFDFNWTLKGNPPFINEPGDDPESPYYDAHQKASAIERQMAANLNVHWAAYDYLFQSPSPDGPIT